MQRKANCIIGKDYPEPILDEHIEKDRCIARIKNAYALGLHGNSAEVIDGAAGSLLKSRFEESGVGAGVVDTEEKEEKKRVEKRKKSGDGNLDGFVKKKRGV